MKDIIIAPVVTEKTAALAENNVYTFKVSKDANKTQVKQAIEEAFNVKVKEVRTLNTKPKQRRVGRYTGMTKTYKKAIITLHDGYTIEV